jgi:transcriptional regulator
MFVPPAFQEDDIAAVHAAIRAARLATLITATNDGLIGTPLPLLLDTAEGPQGTLYGHVAHDNPQWKLKPAGNAMAVFMGPDAYVTPSWYATKRETGKVVPTWNYVAVHAYGPVEFFDDAERLLEVVTRLTDLHEDALTKSSGAESTGTKPWAVTDAPKDFIASQLRRIVGLRMPIARIDAKRKMSQNRSAEDRAGVARALAASERATDRAVAGLIPK